MILHIRSEQLKESEEQQPKGIKRAKIEMGAEGGTEEMDDGRLVVDEVEEEETEEHGGGSEGTMEQKGRTMKGDGTGRKGGKEGEKHSHTVRERETITN